MIIISTLSGFIIGTVVGKVLEKSMSHMDRTEIHYKKIEDDMLERKIRMTNNNQDFGVFKFDTKERY